MFDCWLLNSISAYNAGNKAIHLKKIYKNEGFNDNCDVVKSNDKYEFGFTGEEEFAKHLERRGVSYIYLNKTLNDKACPDRGDFIVNNRLVNLKTQSFEHGNPDLSWSVNVNLKDYEEDAEKGIQSYHFLLFNTKTQQVIYVGNIDYEDVPVYGKLVLKGEPLNKWTNASRTLYKIHCSDLKPLIPDTCRKHEYIPF